MNTGLNDLTRRLLAEGCTRERHPDYVCWGDFQNFAYKWEYMLQFIWETPCGLLVSGESDVGRSLAASDCSYGGADYCPENDNPLLRCPYFRKDCAAVPKGFPLPMCPCHQTQRTYDYAQSVEKIEAEQAQEVHRQYMEITAGSYCACVVGSNGFAGGRVEVKYDVERCIQYGCKNEFCVIRKQMRDLSRANVYYDVRRTWITRMGFLDEKRVEVTKGLKVFQKAVARTDAELWLKDKQAQYNPLQSKSVIEQPKLSMEDHRQSFFSKMHRRYGEYEYFEFHYDVENIRIARSHQRDLLQDLRDTAEGIEVVHAIDLEKAKAAGKRKARMRARDRKQRRRNSAMTIAGDTGEQITLF